MLGQDDARASVFLDIERPERPLDVDHEFVDFLDRLEQVLYEMFFELLVRNFH